jgi:hypothetical protein
MHGQTQQSGPVRTEECAIEPVPSNTGYRYRIILRGECGQLLAALFDDAAIESSRDRTCIIAAVSDDSGLYSLLDRIQDLALHLVSLNELGGDSGNHPPGRMPGGRWKRRLLSTGRSRRLGPAGQGGVREEPR